MIKDAVEITGSEHDDAKEEKLRAFRAGEFSKLVTKPSLAGYGHNWQHCNHQTVSLLIHLSSITNVCGGLGALDRIDLYQ